MSPRKGRPKVDEPKDIRFSIRIDDDTNKKLDDYCEKNGITCLLYTSPSPRDA